MYMKKDWYKWNLLKRTRQIIRYRRTATKNSESMATKSCRESKFPSTSYNIFLRYRE